jgi:hypothetical protein
MISYTLWSTAQRRCVRTEIPDAVLMFFEPLQACIRAMELNGCSGLGVVLPIPALSAAGCEAAGELTDSMRETAYDLRNTHWKAHVASQAAKQGPIPRREPPAPYRSPPHANKRIAGVCSYV